MACVSDVARTREKDGVAWRIGAEDDVAWVREGTRPGVAITSAIPPVFADYATLVLPGNTDVPRDVADERTQDRALLALLETHTTPQPWWLGYLDTGASDIVFWDAPKVKLYEGWDYVLVQAGPEQAASWRPADGWRNWKEHRAPRPDVPPRPLLAGLNAVGRRLGLHRRMYDTHRGSLGECRTRQPGTQGHPRPGRYPSGTRRVVITACAGDPSAC